MNKSDTLPGMDIVFIGTACETFTPTSSGAVATVMHQLARCAIEDGVKPVVLARRSKQPAFDDVPGILFDYPEEPKRGLGLVVRRFERKLAGWTRLRQGEWMHCMAKILHDKKMIGLPWILSNEPELVVFLKRRFPQARMTHVFHNQLECKLAARRAFLASVERVIAVSDFTREWVGRYYGLPDEKVVTIHNAVDHSQFFPNECEPPGVPVINFTGRTGIEKAPDLLLKACIGLAEKTRHFAVQIVGSNHWDRFELDEYQQEIQRLVTALEEKGIKVHRPGHVGRSELPKTIRRAHIHVTPSRWDEPFGLTTLEGMACGLAVVASDTGASREVIGDAGFLFRRDDVRHLSEILEKLVEDHKLRRRYVVAARERAATFTWRKSWNALREVLRAERRIAETAPV